MNLASEIVPQEHPMGCAVACVASRSGLTYNGALSKFSVPQNAWTRGFYCEEIVEALAQLGFNYSWDRYQPKRHADLLKVEGTIVFIDPCDLYPSGHFIIRSKGGWMNPWSSFPHMNPVLAEIQPELLGDVGYLVFEI